MPRSARSCRARHNRTTRTAAAARGGARRRREEASIRGSGAASLVSSAPVLAEQAGRLPEEDHGHQQIDHEARDLGRIHLAQRIDEADQQRRPESTHDRAQPADHDDDERDDEELVSHAGIDRIERRGEHPGHEGQRRADGEHGDVDAARIDAEDIDHLGLLGRGADYCAELGALDPEKQAQRKREAQADDGEAVGGIGEARRYGDGEIEHRRDRHRIEVVADDQRAGFLEQQDQREGQQHLVEVVALVEVAEETALQEGAEQAAAEHRDRQRQPDRTPGVCHQIGDVGAHHQHGAVGQVDDAHHAEDQRQAAGDEKEKQAVLQPVEDLGEEACDVHRRFNRVS